MGSKFIHSKPNFGENCENEQLSPIEGSLSKSLKCCNSPCMQWTKHHRHSRKRFKKYITKFPTSTGGSVGSKLIHSKPNLGENRENEQLLPIEEPFLSY